MKYDTWEIMQGDVRERLADLPDNSIHCVVTSPPYFGLRDYGVEGQIGLELTPSEFVATMVQVFREVRRVLRPDGTCWLVLGDSYYSGRCQPDRMGLKPKDLILMLARVAIALQDDGWWVRSNIAWCKRSPMPEPVRDRPTTAHEHIFLLSKSERYFYDAEAVRVPSGASPGGDFSRAYAAAQPNHGAMRTDRPAATGSRNLWDYWSDEDDVWLLSAEPQRAGHFATFPTEIPRRAILAGTSAHGCCVECGAPWRRVVIASDGTDRRETTGWEPTCSHNAAVMPCTVLDPFSGSGTTVKVALRLQRRAIGIELNPDYLAMSERIIRNDSPLFNCVEAA